jgi:hypothetical protein
MARRIKMSRLGAALLCSLSGGLVGCSFILHDMMGVPGGEGEKQKDSIKFNHEFHVKIILPKGIKDQAKPLEGDPEKLNALLKPEWDKTCSKCHKSIPETRGGKAVQNYKYPGHTECAECHADDVSNNCLKCHTGRPEKGMTFDHEVTGELIFNHDKHTNNAEKQLALNCTNCHVNITDSRSTQDNNIPSMWDCRDCHGGLNSMEEKGAKWACDFCHTEYVEGVQPRTHLGSRPEIPASHDVTFRSVHGRLASKANNGCDRCHDDSSCDRCHFTELPRDHTPRFFKSDHGREATHDRERCATCHEAGFCVGCHSIEPSTHFQANFQAEGHAFLARRDTRSCFACHQFADTCVECHTVQSTTAQGQ